MAQHPSIRRRTGALLVTAFLLVGAAACGSSDKNGSSGTGDSSATGDSPGSSGSGDSAKAGDPCQWYTAKDMEVLLGFPVTMEAQDSGSNRKCVYNAPANYSSVEIEPSDAATFDTQKSYDATPDAVKTAGELKTYDGIGEDAFGHESKGGVDINAKKGATSVQVLITNGGGGPEAGKIDTTEAALAVAKQIVTKTLG